MFDISTWFFISSGLFLGWSLGANNAVTLFGTAVSSKMVRFRVAALVGGVFVLLGAVFSGAGTTNTITSLGGIDAIAGSFTVALAVALSVTWMTRAQLPVSTSQAVVGAIIGWNVFTGSPTDLAALSKIVSTWLVSPLIAGAFGFVIFKLIKRTVLTWRIHMLSLDNYTRIALIVVGALAAYSLGANNIANVMGMFVAAAPFGDTVLTEPFALSGSTLLFVLGGLSIALGIGTYGHKVMETVGKDLFKISPITGFAVVLAEFIVLLLFTSQELETLLLTLGLPTIPLVPLAATQSFVGAVIGVGLAKDPQSVDFKVFGRISLAWVIAPVAAGLLSFVMLYFVQNVFEQKVIDPRAYQLSPSVMQRLADDRVDTTALADLSATRFTNAKSFKNALLARGDFANRDLNLIYRYAVVDSFRIDARKIALLDTLTYADTVLAVIRRNNGRTFAHKIDFDAILFSDSMQWRMTGDKLRDKDVIFRKTQLEELMRVRTTQAR